MFSPAPTARGNESNAHVGGHSVIGHVGGDETALSTSGLHSEGQSGGLSDIRSFPNTPSLSYVHSTRSAGCQFLTPSLQLLTLSFLTLLALSVTALLIYILNPDKEPLPWRAYCTVPVLSSDPPKPGVPVTAPDIFTVGHSAPYPPFPPENFDSLPPAGVFIGVFSVDSSFDRRMMIRETWANHPHSRNGAGVGDEGNGTSRTVVRFIVGQPRKAWERRIKLEMESTSIS